jgi:tryptophanase
MESLEELQDKHIYVFDSTRFTMQSPLLDMSTEVYQKEKAKSIHYRMVQLCYMLILPRIMPLFSDEVKKIKEILGFRDERWCYLKCKAMKCLLLNLMRRTNSLPIVSIGSVNFRAW